MIHYTPILIFRQYSHFLSAEATKAIVQAEKYLFHAERKADSLAKDLFRERKIAVAIIKPRAFILIGSRSQLDTQAKQEDFQILRRSLKNIEVLLYDELLERMENQAKKIYIE